MTRRNKAPGQEYVDAREPKPGQQGELFAPVQFPRGYTPSRMRAVEASSDITGGTQFQQAQLRQELARSSLHTSDLPGGTSYSRRDPRQEYAIEDIGAHASGMFEGNGEDNESGTGRVGRITVAPGQVGNGTVIHEKGHAIDTVAARNDFGLASPSEQGRREGVAESMRAQHARAGGYANPQQEPLGASHYSWLGRYGDSRHGLLQEQQFTDAFYRNRSATEQELNPTVYPSDERSQAMRKYNARYAESFPKPEWEDEQTSLLKVSPPSFEDYQRGARTQTIHPEGT